MLHRRRPSTLALLVLFFLVSLPLRFGATEERTPDQDVDLLLIGHPTVLFIGPVLLPPAEDDNPIPFDAGEDLHPYDD